MKEIALQIHKFTKCSLVTMNNFLISHTFLHKVTILRWRFMVYQQFPYKRFEKTFVKQVWLADNATAGGSIANLKIWWDGIIEEGAKFGYLVNQRKSWLILKNVSKFENAKEIFSNSPINLSTSGQRHLSAVIGDLDFREKYVKEKVEIWWL